MASIDAETFDPCQKRLSYTVPMVREDHHCRLQVSSPTYMPSMPSISYVQLRVNFDQWQYLIERDLRGCLHVLSIFVECSVGAVFLLLDCGAELE